VADPGPLAAFLFVCKVRAVFDELPKRHFAAILVDPPWLFKTWGKEIGNRDPANHYALMTLDQIAAMPVSDLAAEDCILFMWATWPLLKQALSVMDMWGFEYKTCAFAWMKADVSTVDLFPDPVDADMGLGYWTRANSEFCLLGTRGKPLRMSRGVRQGIIEPRRQHSRKPDCIYERIERLVLGPYLELFARQRRKGWCAWGNQVGMFSPVDNSVEKSDWDSMWEIPFAKSHLL
jgi:N6-adenosine-specific RNA methylase IME4